jgi:ABC-type Fe3+-hydroxamate transport system substrate-binding protein
MRHSLLLIALMLLLLTACQNKKTELETLAPTATTPPRVLVLTPEQYAHGGGTRIEQVIEAAGGVNAAHDLNDFAQIADFQILQLNPDIILFSSTWTKDQIDTWVAAEVYAPISAIQNNRYYLLDFSLADNSLTQNFDDRVATLRELFTQS